MFCIDKKWARSDEKYRSKQHIALTHSVQAYQTGVFQHDQPKTTNAASGHNDRNRCEWNCHTVVPGSVISAICPVEVPFAFGSTVSASRRGHFFKLHYNTHPRSDDQKPAERTAITTRCILLHKSRFNKRLLLNRECFGKKLANCLFDQYSTPIEINPN